MLGRNLASSIMLPLFTLVHLARSVGHGLAWLVLIGLRKLLQMRYETGFAMVTLLERAHLRHSLGHASLAVFGTRRIAARIRRAVSVPVGWTTGARRAG